MRNVFQRWELQSIIQKRLIVPQPGTSIARLIASGEISLGFRQLSELINQEHVDLLGPLPKSIQKMTVFAAAVARSCTHAVEAQHFLAFAGAPSFDSIRTRYGMLAPA